MAQARSVSMSKLTATVQAAVKAAVRNRPEFKMDPPKSIASAYLIRGIPVPDAIVARVSLAETRAFANDVAAGIDAGMPGIAAGARGARGAVLSVGGHVIIGIPAVMEAVTLTK